MAFTASTFQYGRGITTCPNNGNGVSTAMHGYKSTTDSYVTITTPGYFPDYIDGTTDKIFVGDTIMISADDVVGLVEVTALAPFAVSANLLGTAGSPIVIAATVAATDMNGLQISGTTVQAEIADATHPGIVTQFAQVFGGLKMFMGGVEFMTFGGTPALLNYYEEYTHNTTFTLGAETTGSVAINVTRIGRNVLISSPTLFTTPGQGAPGTAFIANTPLPARFFPPVNAHNFWRISNGGVFGAGMGFVTGAGVIQIFNNADGTTAYTAAQISGADSGSISYSV